MTATANPPVLGGSQEYASQLKRIQEAPDGATLIRQGEQIRIAHEMRELKDDEAENLRRWYVVRREQIRAAGGGQQQAAQQPQQGQGGQQRQGQQAQQQRPAQQGNQQGSGQRAPAGGFWAHLPPAGEEKLLTGSAPPKPAIFRRPLAEILYDLRTKVHPQMVEKRRQGGQDLDYISWHVRARHLDVYAPGWTDEIRQVGSIQGIVPSKEIHITGGDYCAQPTYFIPAANNNPEKRLVPQTLVYVIARLTIPAYEGEFWHEATGYEDITATGFGDPFSNASAMALSRCCSKFGQGIHLYD